MSGRLKDKTAFVTAAAQGIGRAIALALAEAGAKVIATDVNEARLAEIAGKVARIERLDALDAGQIAAAAAAAGAVDILCNCAGFVHQGTILEATEEEWDFAFALNVKSMFRTMRAFLPGMVERGQGSIVNIASAVGTQKGAPRRAIYAATKAAVVGLTRAVATDYVAHGIRCNAICPGTVETPSLGDRIAANAAAAGGIEAARTAFVARQAMGRLAAPEEIAALAVYLASDESRFMTGQALVIDGGFTL